jgi:F-type H+-transporting ATPase subunit epsilon
VPLQVELVSPERILFTGDADMVIARTSDGDIAFMPGHTPFVGTLGIGAVKIHLTGGGEETAAVHGGFVEVYEDHVIVLSDVAELASQIDEERARRALERMERKEHDLDDVEAEAALRRARVRIALATS